MNNKVKLFVTIDRYYPVLGGAQNCVRALVKYLVKEKHNVVILTRRTLKNMRVRQDDNGSSIVRFGYFPIRTMSKIITFFSILVYLIINKRKYDIVLSVPCAEFTDLLPVYIASFLTNKPYIMRMTGVHNFDDDRKLTEKSLGMAIRDIVLPKGMWVHVVKKAHAIVGQSQALKDISVLYKDAVVIPNGVDIELFEPAHKQKKLDIRDKLNILENKFVIITTGRFSTDKNQLVLLKALELMMEKYDDVLLLIVGARDGNSISQIEHELKKYVSEKKLDSFVRFFINVENVDQYLKASDVFVLPSLTEGMSNSLLEAISCGLPVIASDIPQISCVFDGQQAFLHEPSDFNKIYSYIELLYMNEELRKKVGCKLRRLAVQVYSNDAMANKYEKLFLECLSK